MPLGCCWLIDDRSDEIADLARPEEVGTDVSVGFTDPLPLTWL